MYIAIYVNCNRVMFYYIGLYMELEQENICSYLNIQQVVAT